ncbi:MAG TPA: hypothetical protein VGL10_06125 [Gammaproteobacteria bacterium]
MRIVIFTLILVLAGTLSAHAAEDAFWKWDGDGASKVMLADDKCECYFTLSFPEKVIPQPDRHFVLGQAPSQIISIHQNIFLKANSGKLSAEEILRYQYGDEISYLKSRIGADKLRPTVTKWNADTKVLQWQAEIHEGNTVKTIVAASAFREPCVIYLTSFVENKNEVVSISNSLVKAIATLESHRPSSQEEAHKLLSEYLGR